MWPLVLRKKKISGKNNVLLNSEVVFFYRAAISQLNPLMGHTVATNGHENQETQKGIQEPLKPAQWEAMGEPVFGLRGTDSVWAKTSNLGMLRAQFSDAAQHSDKKRMPSGMLRDKHPNVTKVGDQKRIKHTCSDFKVWRIWLSDRLIVWCMSLPELNNRDAESRGFTKQKSECLAWGCETQSSDFQVRAQELSPYNCNWQHADHDAWLWRDLSWSFLQRDLSIWLLHTSGLRL